MFADVELERRGGLSRRQAYVKVAESGGFGAMSPRTVESAYVKERKRSASVGAGRLSGSPLRRNAQILAVAAAPNAQFRAAVAERVERNRRFLAVAAAPNAQFLATAAERAERNAQFLATAAERNAQFLAAAAAPNAQFLAFIQATFSLYSGTSAELLRQLRSQRFAALCCFPADTMEGGERCLRMIDFIRQTQMSCGPLRRARRWRIGAVKAEARPSSRSARKSSIVAATLTLGSTGIPFTTNPPPHNPNRQRHGKFLSKRTLPWQISFNRSRPSWSPPSRRAASRLSAQGMVGALNVRRITAPALTLP